MSSEGLGLEDTDVVDQDLDLREGLGERRASFAGAEIGRDTRGLAAGHGFEELGHRRVDAALRSPVEGDGRSLGGEGLGDGEADAGGGARDECALALELKIHECVLGWREGVVEPARRFSQPDSMRGRAILRETSPGAIALAAPARLRPLHISRRPAPRASIRGHVEPRGDHPGHCQPGPDARATTTAPSCAGTSSESSSIRARGRSAR